MHAIKHMDWHVVASRWVCGKWGIEFGRMADGRPAYLLTYDGKVLERCSSPEIAVEMAERLDEDGRA